MKATLEILDDLYRRVKARSAVEGRPVRSVAVQLFSEWLEAQTMTGQQSPHEEQVLTEEDFARFPWLRISRQYLKPGLSHALDEIREAIDRGWEMEVAKKLNAHRL